MNDIDRWFSEPDFAMPSPEHQDWDLILGKPEYFPRLKDYIDDVGNPEAKRVEAVYALLVLLEDHCPNDGGPEIVRLAKEIRDVVRRHADIAKLVMEDSSDAHEIVIRKMLGLPIPDYFSQWDREQASEIEGPYRGTSS